ncbi:MAG TPA: hypothetical protein VK846_16495 [Candidatus Limnocylindria bacterium]|nr:hypothetical protein [Candidatus Limnocylindria bacterium]
MTPAQGFFILASAFEDQVKKATQGSAVNSRELLLGILIVLVIGSVLFAWVFFRFRKRADREDQKRLSQMTRSIRSDHSESTDEKGERRRKRRRKRPHRPRNASLDETGGLPPPRADDQLPKF